MSVQNSNRNGIKKLKEELEYLKMVRRRELAEQLERAMGYGDISENAEFQEAKAEQAFVEGRILELEEMLRQVLEPQEKMERGRVQVGSTVLVASGKTKEQFIIVGPAEVDPALGKISIDSPLGRVLLGKSEGTEVMVETPEGKKKYRIIRIA